MNTDKTIQDNGNKLCIDLINGSKQTAKFVREVIAVAGNDTDMIQTNVQALVDRHYSKLACSADPARLAAYAVFRAAWTAKLINSYHVDGDGGLLFVSFKDPEGTPKDSKARFVTVIYKTPAEVEQEAQQASREEAKQAAEVKQDAEQREQEAATAQAARTADQVLDLMLNYMPTITALKPEDIYKAWQDRVAFQADQEAAKLRAEKASKEANRIKQEASNKANKAKQEQASKVHKANKAQGQREIDSRKTA